MINVFIDTDIVLDLFLDRQPHLENARKIFQLASEQRIKLFSSITTFTNSYYILRRLIANTRAKEKLDFLEKRVTVLDTKHEIVKQALVSRFSDFEDAIQHYTAISHKMDVLITRNIKDYKNALLPIKTAADFLSQV